MRWRPISIEPVRPAVLASLGVVRVPSKLLEWDKPFVEVFATVESTALAQPTVPLIQMSATACCRVSVVNSVARADAAALRSRRTTPAEWRTNGATSNDVKYIPED